MFNFSYGWIEKVEPEQMAVKTPMATYMAENLHTKICNLVYCRLLPCKCQGTSGLKTLQNQFDAILYLLFLPRILISASARIPDRKGCVPRTISNLVFHFPTSENSWKLKSVLHEAYCLQRWSYLGNNSYIWKNWGMLIHKVHIY